MGGGVRIVDDYVVKLSSDAFKAFDDLVNDPDEPARGGTAALRHDAPLEKSVRCAEGSEGNCLLIDGNLVEGGDEVGQGKVASFVQESRISPTRGTGSCPKELMAFSFLQLMVMRTPPSFLGTATIGLEYGEMKCRMRLAARNWSMMASASWPGLA